MITESDPLVPMAQVQILTFFVYKNTLVQTFNTSFLFIYNHCEFATRKHKFKVLFCTEKLGLNACFKDFVIQL